MGALDPDFLTVQTHQMFASLYPGDGRAAAREALDRHAKALADGVLAPIELDARLIATARETIRNQAVGTRAYDILAGLPQARELMEWTPATAFGPLGRACLRAAQQSADGGRHRRSFHGGRISQRRHSAGRPCGAHRAFRRVGARFR